jgi:protein-tyrosine kinase
LNADDAMAVLPKIDCALMVVGNGMSTQHDLEESLRLLTSTDLIGTVINREESVSGNAYYYK